MAALMKYGIKNEPVAAKTDSEITGNVCICGFLINQTTWKKKTRPSKDSFTECKYLVENKNINHSYKL